jgi:iron complex transport system substrate-binding protein
MNVLSAKKQKLKLSACRSLPGAFYSLLPAPCSLLLTAYSLLFLLCPLISYSYERVISLSPQITESIYLLGAGEKLIGVTELCKRPKEAAKKERIGTPLRPDIEKIVSLRPDLILGTREGNPPLAMERLKRFGMKVHYFVRPKTLNDLLGNFLILSHLLMKDEIGERIVNNVKNSLDEIKTGKRYRVLWQVGVTPLIVASDTSFANDIIRIAGGINIVETEMPYPRMNIEEVMVKGPQIIVLMDMGYNIELEIKQWRKYVKDARFVVMDSYIVGSPTPVSFLEAVNKLAEAFKNVE